MSDRSGHFVHSAAHAEASVKMPMRSIIRAAENLGEEYLSLGRSIEREHIIAVITKFCSAARVTLVNSDFADELIEEIAGTER